MSLKESNKALLKALIPSIAVIAAMWFVYLLQKMWLPEITGYGVRPKDMSGLWGILSSPLLHNPDGFGHIINNSFPMLILTWALYYFYRQMAGTVLTLVWLTSGLCVWITGAAHTNHIGMSGVIYGLAGFLFLSGVLRKNRNLTALSLFIVFEYGSMVWGVLPIQPGVSWEGHLWGAIVGLTLAVFFRKDGPQRKKYQWEIEEELGLDEDDTDYWKIEEPIVEHQEHEKPVSFRYFFKPDDKNKPN